MDEFGVSFQLTETGKDFPALLAFCHSWHDWFLVSLVDMEIQNVTLATFETLELFSTDMTVVRKDSGMDGSRNQRFKNMI